jgi:hypothetical protein
MSDPARTPTTEITKLRWAVSISALNICISIGLAALAISIAIGRLHP